MSSKLFFHFLQFSYASTTTEAFKTVFTFIVSPTFHTRTWKDYQTFQRSELSVMLCYNIFPYKHLPSLLPLVPLVNLCPCVSPIMFPFRLAASCFAGLETNGDIYRGQAPWTRFYIAVLRSAQIHEYFRLFSCKFSLYHPVGARWRILNGCLINIRLWIEKPVNY